MNHLFPDGILLKVYVGKLLHVQGNQYLVERVLAEKYDDDLVQRVALFEAKRSDNQETVILKIRFQMDPEPILDTGRDAVLQSAKDWFRDEARCLADCQTTAHWTPNFYGQEELVQDATDLYPGGYMHIIAMSKVPGRPVTGFTRFSTREINTIRKQLTEILEHMRQQ